MRIGEVDIPRFVPDSLASGNLVIFAGAGVSYDAPSNLPLFNRLAEKIVGSMPDENEALDRFLGDATRRGIDVHRRTRDILKLGDPNANHRVLLKLFGRPSKLRVVTTNYDLLLEQAAENMDWTDVPSYRAPALPLGNDFHGIVHVHGALDDHPHRLVITDSDFSRAYMTQGWARRFLVSLFSHHDVLFVGYSHDDMVVSYLAKGLPSELKTRRYALSPEPEADDEREDAIRKWKNLGIHPCFYPVDRSGENECHSALTDALTGLAELRARGVLEIKERLENIASNYSVTTIDSSRREPLLSNEDEELLTSALSRRSEAPHFLWNTDDPRWMWWLQRRGFLDPIFRDEPLEPPQQAIVKWLGKRMAVEHPDEFFAVLEAALGPATVQTNLLSSWLSRILLRYLSSRSADSEHLRRWIPLIIQSGELRNQTNKIYLLLERCVDSELTDTSLFLLSELLRPQYYIRKRPTAKSEDTSAQRWVIRPEVCAGGFYFQLTDVLNTLRQQLEPVQRQTLLARLLVFLRELSLLVEREGGVDPGVYYRSTIASSTHQRTTTNTDIFVDLTRDILMDRLECDSLSAPEIRRLLDSDVPIIRRLGLHVLRLHSAIAPPEKLQSILRHDWLFSVELRPEVFAVLQDTFSDVSHEIRTDVLLAISEFTDPQQEAIDVAYQKFNILTWLEESLSECPEVSAQLAEMREEFPDFEAREHPNLLYYSASPPNPNQKPQLSMHEAHALSAREYLTYLLESPETTNFNQLVAVTAEYPTKSVEMLMLTDPETPKHHDIIAGLLLGLEKADLPESLPQELLNVIGDFVGVPDFALHISLLLHTISNHSSINESDATTLLRLSDQVSYDSDTRRFPQMSWFEEAVNHPAGSICEMLVVLLSRALDEWNDFKYLPARITDRLESLIEADTVEAKTAVAMLTSHLPLLLPTYLDWTKSTVLPHLNFEQNRETTPAAWAGLASVRPTDDTYTHCLDLYRDGLPHFVELDRRTRHGVVSHIAEFVVYHASSPLESWIWPFYRQLPVDERPALLRSLRDFLESLDPEHQVAAWESWLGEFWRQRCSNRPDPLANMEAAHLLNFAAISAELLACVTNELRCLSVEPELDELDFHSFIHDAEIAHQAPDETFELVDYILANATTLDRFATGSTDVFLIITKLLDRGATNPRFEDIFSSLEHLNWPNVHALRQKYEENQNSIT